MPKPTDEPAKGSNPEEPLSVLVPLASAEESKDPKSDWWKLAYERANLNKEEARILKKPLKEDGTACSALGFLEDIKNAIGERYADPKKNDWTTKGSRTAIAFRAKKVLGAVLEMKELVNARLKFDVTGYGATAWSAVTFALQAIIPALDPRRGSLNPMLATCPGRPRLNTSAV